MKLGDYELLREHGGIGAGAVWIARAESDTAESPKLFTVTRVHKHLLKKADAAEALDADTKPAVGFRHANTAALVHVGDVGGEIVAVSDHHEGELLSALLTAAGAEGLPAPVVVRIALDVLEALAAAHENDPPIFHGELGPHQVLVGVDGVARVLGLGTARAFSRLAPPIGVKNQDRLAYAAPERVKALSSPIASTSAGAPLDARSDLFSVGVMLWEGVTKQRLFASKIDAAIVQKVLTAPIAALSTHAPAAPAALEAAVQKVLERDPQKRTRSAAMVIAALEGIEPDRVATAAQVAEVVEKLAGKAIAARRADLAKPAAAPASVKLGEPAGSKLAVQPRKATLLGIASPVAKAPAPATTGDAPAAPPSSKPEPAPAAGSRPPSPSKPEVSAKSPSIPKPASTPKPAAADIPPARPPAVSSEEISEVIEVESPGDKPAAAPPAPAPKRPVTMHLGSPASKLTQPETPKPEPIKVETPKPEPAKAEAEPVKAEPPKQTAIEALQATSAEVPKSASSAKPATPSQLLESASKTSHTPGSDGQSPASRARGLGSEKVGPGSTLGRYEILTPVARGGMASVWAARLPGSRGFQKIFAIKTMLPDVSDDPDFENMFLDEGRVAARIRHPNVVEIIDLGEQDEVLYLVMEWVEGENLGALVKAARAIGGVPLPIVLKIASQIAAGLHAAHELRDDDGNLVDLVHRDVSPANVLVSTSGYVKIVDFGIAKSKGRLHQTRVGGVVKGKTPYLSPEQLGQLPIDRRSDLFSLGVLLYVLTTGLHPFRGETDAKTIENIALREPVPLRNIVPSTPPEFETVVLKALSKDAKDRYSTAAEMHRAIEQAAAANGMMTTEEDIAAFVKKALGEAITKRAQDLRAAIDRADGRTPSIAEAEEPPDSIDPLAATEMQADGSAVKTAAITMPEIAVDAKPSDTAKPADEAGAAPPGDQPDAPVDVALDEPPKPAPHLAMPPPPPEPAPPPAAVVPASPPPESTDAPLELPQQPKRRKPVALVAVGAVLTVCAIIGGIALFGGGKPASDPPRPAATARATSTPAPVRTAAPAPTPSAAETAAPAETTAPTPAPADTATAAPGKAAAPQGGKAAPIKPGGKLPAGPSKKSPGKFNPTGI